MPCLCHHLPCTFTLDIECKQEIWTLQTLESIPGKTSGKTLCYWIVTELTVGMVYSDLLGHHLQMHKLMWYSSFLGANSPCKCCFLCHSAGPVVFFPFNFPRGSTVGFARCCTEWPGHTRYFSLHSKRMGLSGCNALASRYWKTIIFQQLCSFGKIQQLSMTKFEKSLPRSPKRVPW